MPKQRHTESLFPSTRISRLNYLGWASGAFLLLLLALRLQLFQSGYLSHVVLVSGFVAAVVVLAFGSMRRLRDLDCPSTAVICLFVPFLGLLALIVLLACRGSEGPNRYGPAPAEPSSWTKAVVVVLAGAALTGIGFTIYLFHALSHMSFM